MSLPPFGHQKMAARAARKDRARRQNRDRIKMHRKRALRLPEAPLRKRRVDAD